MTTQKIYYCHIIVHFMYVFKRPGKGISRRKKKKKKKRKRMYNTYLRSFWHGRLHTYVCSWIDTYVCTLLYVCTF